MQCAPKSYGGFSSLPTDPPTDDRPEPSCHHMFTSSSEATRERATANQFLQVSWHRADSAKVESSAGIMASMSNADR